MKVLMLSDPGSSHTIKWANALNNKGIEIFVFGFSDFDKRLYNDKVNVESYGLSSDLKKKADGSFSKWVYLKSLNMVKKIIDDFKPDLIHVQYATSYGLVGVLSNFHPLLIQVWGSDVYSFPEKSFLHAKILKYNLNKADIILSTSKCMLRQTKKFTNKDIEFFYLGVDPEKFKPLKIMSFFNTEEIVIGTIKTLEKKYGIEYKIKAFKIVKDQLPLLQVKLLIVGSGSLEKELKKLVIEYNLENDTVFTGFIQPKDVPRYYNMLDIYVTLSIEESESFGLAVIEAAACEVPAVVSNVGGLPEAVEDNVTGFIVESKNVQQAANALIKLITDRKLKNKMGKMSRERVIRDFNWNEKVIEMLNLYRKTISG